MRLLSLLLVPAFGAASVAQAQSPCFLPDNLDSAFCCTPVQLALPAFPPTSLLGSGLEWNSCNLAAQNCISIDISPPTPSATCGQYDAAVKVVDCSGVALLDGKLVLDYTRTWHESFTAGAVDYQVWRFTAKADMRLVPGAPVTAPVPNSLVSGAQWAFFYGYVDYAYHCATNTWEQSVVMYHGCDRFQHMPGFSQFPGVFDPTSSFAFVGPDTVGNPFVPSAIPIPAAPVFGEAIRNVGSSTAGLCSAEDFVTTGSFVPLLAACMCPLSLVPPQQILAKLTVGGNCGNKVQALNVFPSLPWFYSVSTSIGSWTTAASYPGPERAHAIEGLFLNIGVCGSTGVVSVSFDVNYGAITQGGIPVLPTPISIPSQTFLDMASNFSLPLGAPLSLPVVGTVRPTRHLTYINL